MADNTATQTTYADPLDLMVEAIPLSPEQPEPVFDPASLPGDDTLDDPALAAEPETPGPKIKVKNPEWLKMLAAPLTTSQGGPASTAGSLIQGGVAAVTNLSPSKGMEEFHKAQKEYEPKDVYNPETQELDINKFARSKYSQGIRSTILKDFYATSQDISPEVLGDLAAAYGITDKEDNKVKKVAKGLWATLTGITADIIPSAINWGRNPEQDAPITPKYRETYAKPLEEILNKVKAGGKAIKFDRGMGEYFIYPNDTPEEVLRKDYMQTVRTTFDMYKQGVQSGATQNLGLISAMLIPGVGEARVADLAEKAGELALKEALAGGATAAVAKAAAVNAAKAAAAAATNLGEAAVSPLAQGGRKLLASQMAKKLVPRIAAAAVKYPTTTGMLLRAGEQGILAGGAAGLQHKSAGEAAHAAALGAGTGIVMEAGTHLLGTGAGKILSRGRELPAAKGTEHVPVPEGHEPSVGPIDPAITTAPDGLPEPAAPRTPVEHAPATAGADPRAITEMYSQASTTGTEPSQTVDMAQVMRAGGTTSTAGARDAVALSRTFKQGESPYIVHEDLVRAANAPERATAEGKGFYNAMRKYQQYLGRADLPEIMVSMGDEHLAEQFRLQRNLLPEEQYRQYQVAKVIRDATLGAPGEVAMAESGAISTGNAVNKETPIVKAAYLDAANKQAEIITNAAENMQAAQAKIMVGLDSIKDPAARPAVEAIARLVDDSIRTSTVPNMEAIHVRIRSLRGVVDPEVMTRVYREIDKVKKNAYLAREASATLPALMAQHTVTDASGVVAPQARKSNRAEAMIEQISRGGTPEEAQRMALDNAAPLIVNLDNASAHRVASDLFIASHHVQSGEAVPEAVLKDLTDHYADATKNLADIRQSYAAYREALASKDANKIAAAQQDLANTAQNIPQLAGAADNIRNGTPSDIASTLAAARKEMGEGTIVAGKRMLDGFHRFSREVEKINTLKESVGVMQIGDVPAMLVRLNNLSRNLAFTKNLEVLGKITAQVRDKFMESVQHLEVDIPTKIKMYEMLTGDVVTQFRLSGDASFTLKAPDYVLNMIEVNNALAKEFLDTTVAALDKELGVKISREFLMSYFLRPESLVFDAERMRQMALDPKALEAQTKFWKDLHESGSYLKWANEEAATRAIGQRTQFNPLVAMDNMGQDLKQAGIDFTNLINKAVTKDIQAKIEGDWKDPNANEIVSRWDGKGQHIDHYDKSTFDPEHPDLGVYSFEPVGKVVNDLFVESGEGKRLVDAGRDAFVEDAYGRLQKEYAAAGDAKAADPEFLATAAEHLYYKWHDMAEVPQSVWQDAMDMRQFGRSLDRHRYAEVVRILAEQNARYAHVTGISVPTPKFRERFMFNLEEFNPEDKVNLRDDVFFDDTPKGYVKSSDAGQIKKAENFDGRAIVADSFLNSVRRRAQNSIHSARTAGLSDYFQNIGYMMKDVGFDADATWINTHVRGGDLHKAVTIINQIEQGLENQQYLIRNGYEIAKAVANIFLPVKTITLGLSSARSLWNNSMNQFLQTLPGYLKEAASGNPSALLKIPQYHLRILGQMFRNQRFIPDGDMGLIARESLREMEMAGQLRRQRIETDMKTTVELAWLGKKALAVNEGINSMVNYISSNFKERFEVAASRVAKMDGMRQFYKIAETIEQKGLQDGYAQLRTLFSHRTGAEAWNLAKLIESGSVQGKIDMINMFSNDTLGRFGKYTAPQGLHSIGRAVPGTTMFFAARTNGIYRLAGDIFSTARTGLKGTSEKTHGILYAALCAQLLVSLGVYSLQHGGVFSWLPYQEDDKERTTRMYLGAGDAAGIDFEAYDPSGFSQMASTLFGKTRPGYSSSAIRPFSVEGDLIMQGLRKWNQTLGEVGAPHFGLTEAEKLDEQYRALMAEQPVTSEEVTAWNTKKETMDAARAQFAETRDENKVAKYWDLILGSSGLTNWIQKTVTNPIAMAQLAYMHKNGLAYSSLSAGTDTEAMENMDDHKKFGGRPIQSMVSLFNGLETLPWDVPHDEYKVPDWMTELAGEGLIADLTRYARDFDDTYNALAIYGAVKPMNPNKNLIDKQLVPKAEELPPPDSTGDTQRTRELRGKLGIPQK